eukprot:gene3507-6155_t
MKIFTTTELEELCEAIESYELTNGIIMKAPKNETDSNHLYIALPTTMFPSKLNRKTFEKLKLIMPIMSLCRDRVARDFDFIHSSLKDAAASDEFLKNLLNIYETIQKEGIKQKKYLGIHRSDYMFHYDKNEDVHIPYQVEINMISSGFGSMSSKTNQLHKYITERFPCINKMYENHQIELSNSYNDVPDSIKVAHDSFGKGDIVIFVIQEHERNIGDQKHLEHYLWEKYQLQVQRLTFKEILEKCEMNSETNEITFNGKVISVFYFRAGYTPNDYPTDNEWKSRLMIERSTAIKCPSIAYQLCGTKKIQQLLTKTDLLEKYVTKEEGALLKEVFTGIWDLENNDEMIEKAIKNTDLYVVKPQREGGGNLVHGDAMKKFLETITNEQRKEYILMQKIKPLPFDSMMLREGNIISGKSVSELGIFGTFLGDEKKIILNEYAGYLLRTKLEHHEDGGVASGVANMDSLALK